MKIVLAYWHSKVLGLILVMLMLISFHLISTSESVSAQSSQPIWDEPQEVFATNGRASNAVVVADSNGAAHLFWGFGSEVLEGNIENQSIFYAKIENGGISEPTDILVSPSDLRARTPQATIDDRGFLHVVWSGGNAILHSTSFVNDAHTARGWRMPMFITSGQSALEPFISFVGGTELVIVWSNSSQGLMLSKSNDYGESWSNPRVVFGISRVGENIRWGRLATDKNGILHLVLTQVTKSTDSDSGADDMLLYYLRSDTKGQSWSQPFLLSKEPDFGQASIVIRNDNEVHVVWNGRSYRRGRFHRWSPDNGLTWNQPVKFIGSGDTNLSGGLTGMMPLITDNSGQIHTLSTGTENHHLQWADSAWSKPRSISAEIEGMGISGSAQSVESPSLAITNGNQIHAVFHDGFERIWHVSGALPLPKSPSVPYSAPRNASELQLPKGQNEESDVKPLPSPIQNSTQASKPISPIITSAFASLIVVFGVAGITNFVKNR